jgi:phage baseplate assembly protein W
MTTLYSDLSLSFDQNPVTGDVRPVAGERAVKSALLNLLRTDLGTRPSNPEYGTRIKEYLFAPADSITEGEIIDDVADSIERFEPRVFVTAMEANVKENGIEIVVEYYVKEFGNPQTLETTISRV